MNSSSNKKFALVLGSGAGRGLFQLGVIKSLEKHDLEPDIITGASIGAIVGAMYASGKNYQEIYEAVFEKKSKYGMLMSFFDLTFFKGGVLSGRKFSKILSKWIKVKKIEDLEIPFGCLATDLVSGKIIDFTKGNLIRAVRASSSVPFMFKPVTIDKMLLVDGGVSDPVPVKLALKMGAEVTLAINLDSTQNFKGNVKRLKLAGFVAMRTFNLYKHKIAEYSLKQADIVLNPDLSSSGVIALDSFVFEKKAEELIDLGETMMDSRIKELKVLLA